MGGSPELFEIIVCRLRRVIAVRMTSTMPLVKVRFTIRWWAGTRPVWAWTGSSLNAASISRPISSSRLRNWVVRTQSVAASNKVITNWAVKKLPNDPRTQCERSSVSEAGPFANDRRNRLTRAMTTHCAPRVTTHSELNGVSDCNCLWTYSRSRRMNNRIPAMISACQSGKRLRTRTLRVSTIQAIIRKTSV